MKRAAVLVVTIVWCAPAFASPPPHHALPSSAPMTHVRSVLHHLAEGCFHVAPRQFICPMPYKP